MILVQEATTHNEEVTPKAKEQFYLYYGADQLILFHKTFCAQSSKANFGARGVRPAAVPTRGSAMNPAGTCARTTGSHREWAVSCFRIYCCVHFRAHSAQHGADQLRRELERRSRRHQRSQSRRPGAGIALLTVGRAHQDAFLLTHCSAVVPMVS